MAGSSMRSRATITGETHWSVGLRKGSSEELRGIAGGCSWRKIMAVYESQQQAPGRRRRSRPNVRLSTGPPVVNDWPGADCGSAAVCIDGWTLCSGWKPWQPRGGVRRPSETLAVESHAPIDDGRHRFCRGRGPLRAAAPGSPARHTSSGFIAPLADGRASGARC